MQVRFNTQNDQAIETARAYGLQIVEPDAEFQAAVQAWIEAGVGDMAGAARTTYGIQDPDAFFASFMPYVEEWSALIAGMNDINDVDEMTALIMEHMMGDIDVNVWGMQ